MCDTYGPKGTKGIDMSGVYGTTVTLLGGDARQWAVARRLAAEGYTVQTLGMGTGDGAGDLPAGVRVCGHLQRALEGSRALVLPLPVTRDGGTVWSPLDPDKGIALEEPIRALARLDAPWMVMGGRMPAAFRDMVTLAGGRSVDYYDSEVLQIENARITAEGAVMTAMAHTDGVLLAAPVVVVGYGRIGQMLARLLVGWGAKVTVVARRPESRAWAEADGCAAADLPVPEEVTRGCEVLFNTVPVPLIGKDILRGMKRNALVVDLASAPGGILPDGAREAAVRSGPRILREPSLPGRYAPRTAGEVIARRIAEILCDPDGGGEVSV